MNKLTNLLILLALILAGCSGNSSTSSDPDEISSEQLSSSVIQSSDTQSSSSTGISVVPPMSSPYSSSIGSSAGSSTNTSSSSIQVATVPISFYKIGGLAKRLYSIDEMTASTYDIELDTIAMTSSFQFLLKNNSTSVIRGIKFTSTLPYFKVTPDSVITLGAPNSNTGMEQLIKVTVEHGTNASGMGFADVLTGNQYATITISGTNDDGDFSVSYTMHVYAKRMVIYTDELDTMAVNPTLNPVAQFKSKADYINDPYAWQPTKFAYVDSHTGDCYMNYVQSGLLIDNTINREFVSEREPYGDDGLNNGVGEVLATKLLFTNEKDLYTKVISGAESPDMNCVVMVINRLNNTEFIVK